MPHQSAPCAFGLCLGHARRDPGQPSTAIVSPDTIVTAGERPFRPVHQRCITPLLLSTARIKYYLTDVLSDYSRKTRQTRRNIPVGGWGHPGPGYAPITPTKPAAGARTKILPENRTGQFVRSGNTDSLSGGASRTNCPSQNTRQNVHQRFTALAVNLDAQPFASSVNLDHWL